MTSTLEILEISPSKLERIVALLKLVGLDADDRLGFADHFQSAASYDLGRIFEWTERGLNMRFISERSWSADRVTGLYVYSLSDFTGGSRPFSSELISQVNRDLAFIFAEEDWVEETADLPPVDVTHVDYGSQLAVVILEDGRKIGINLWELAGRTRRSDNYANWKYRDSGRI